MLCGLASDQYPQPETDPGKTVVRYPDGARAEYDHKAGSLKISGIKTAEIEAAETMKFVTPKAEFTGEVQINGLLTFLAGLSGSNKSGGAAMQIRGDLIHEMGKLSSNGVVLHLHIHTGDSGGKTGAPQ